MKNIILGIFLSAGLFSQAQTRCIILPFDGEVGKYPVAASLEISDDVEHAVNGQYRYLNSENTSSIDLSGAISNNLIRMDESYYSTQHQKWESTGSFSGTITADYLIKGTWSNPEGSRTFDFTLRPRIKNIHSNLQFECITTEDFELETINPEAKDYYLLITGVIIKDETGKEIQHISGLHHFVYKENSYRNIKLADINFDGTLDLIVEYNIPERWQSDYAQLYFIYNPSIKRFERNAQLEALEVVRPDYFDNTLKHYEMDGRGNESTGSYSYQDGRYYLTKLEKWDENEEHTVTTYEIRNGESVVKEGSKL